VNLVPRTIQTIVEGMMLELGGIHRRSLFAERGKLLEDRRARSHKRARDFEEEVAAVMAVFPDYGLPRKHALLRRRWDEPNLRALAINEGKFVTEFRMPPDAFDALSEMLEPKLLVNEHYASLRSSSGPITPHARLGAALVRLGGGRTLESMRTFGMAETTARDNFVRVVRAINSHPDLAITCDNSVEACTARAKGFQKLAASSPKTSNGAGLFEYLTGCIDGIALECQIPGRAEAPNQTAYVSGSKKMSCLNVQVVCDSECRVLFVSANHVGSTHDSVAFATGLARVINEAQPFPFHWNGDPAYLLSRTMIIPFGGVNLHITFPSQEAFNFYHSQLRITVERTLGIFIQRWGYFWQASRTKVKFFSEVIHACFRLHNFLINRKCPTPTCAAAACAEFQPRVDDRGRLVGQASLTYRDPKKTRPNHDDWSAGSAGVRGNYLRQKILEQIENNTHKYNIQRSHRAVKINK
jgi:hypothetical protein